MGKYDDIINMPHHISDFHKPMSMANRAAQFAPFAALSGYENAISETSRITEVFKELTEEEKNLLSRKLSYAVENQSLTEITYFISDKRKTGGYYHTVTGRIKNRDEYDNTLELRNGLIIQIDLISGVEIKESDVLF